MDCYWTLSDQADNSPEQEKLRQMLIGRLNFLTWKLKSAEQYVNTSSERLRNVLEFIQFLYTAKKKKKPPETPFCVQMLKCWYRSLQNRRFWHSKLESLYLAVRSLHTSMISVAKFKNNERLQTRFLQQTPGSHSSLRFYYAASNSVLQNPNNLTIWGLKA
ncbi:hypothetical protein F4860DRAFT_430327 [Xylaria cubensis]|nr:hypothetical protein F4860DRAFT_430327 [Xylaria cubensis]